MAVAPKSYDAPIVRGTTVGAVPTNLNHNEQIAAAKGARLDDVASTLYNAPGTIYHATGDVTDSLNDAASSIYNAPSSLADQTHALGHIPDILSNSYFYIRLAFILGGLLLMLIGINAMLTDKLEGEAPAIAKVAATAA